MLIEIKFYPGDTNFQVECLSCQVPFETKGFGTVYGHRILSGADQNGRANQGRLRIAQVKEIAQSHLEQFGDLHRIRILSLGEDQVGID